MSKTIRMRYWVQDEFTFDTADLSTEELDAFDPLDIGTWPDALLDQMTMTSSGSLYDWEIEEL